MATVTEDSKASPSPIAAQAKSQYYKWYYLAIGITILLVSTITPAPTGMKPAAVRTLAVMITAVLWWVTEALPIPVTALMIPLMVHALGIMPFDLAIRESFGNSLIPFMVGVLGLSAALNDSGLGKRITYWLLSLAGTNTTMVVGAYLWLSFAISMFIDDLAVVAMMLPLVVGLLKTVDAPRGTSNFGKGLMMAIIFGTVIGGVATPAGVSSNFIAMQFVAKSGLQISFLQWTMLATPSAIVINLITWWIIMKLFPPEMARLPYGGDVLKQELKKMGSWSVKEITTVAVFLVAVVLWLTSDKTHLPIAFVSLLVLGGMTLPGIGVCRTWRDLRIEWGGVVLLVGGFVVGVASSRTGLAAWVVERALHPMAALPHFLQPAAVTLLIAADSLGFSSFGTTASVNVPFIIAYAQLHGLPLMALTVTAGIASSIHFILVTQSPSLTLPYAAGYFSFKDLAKIGFLVTLVSALVLSIGMTVAGMPAGTVVAVH